jgi:hypothetical protein
MLGITLTLLCTFICVSSYTVRLGGALSLHWEIVNPKSKDTEKLVKFTLELKNHKKGWAGIGWRLDPNNYRFPMANTDYVICYINEPDIDEKEMGCFDGFLFTNNEKGADGRTNWEDVMPIPVKDTDRLVGGQNNIEFVKGESSRSEVDGDIITKWIFLRRVDTGDTKGDAVLSKKNIQAVWAYHESNAKWETESKYWNDETRPAYHGGMQRGKFVFNLVPSSDQEL